MTGPFSRAPRDHPCDNYPGTGLLFNQQKVFTHQAGNVFIHRVSVYRTSTNAHEAYRVTSTPPSPECVESSRNSLAEAIEALDPNERLEEYRQVNLDDEPPLGSNRAASWFQEWRVLNTSTGESYTRRNYSFHILVGNVSHAFMLLSSDGSSLIPDYAETLDVIVGRSSAASSPVKPDASAPSD